MQKAVEPQTVHIQRVRSQLTGQFAELLLDFLGDAHIKHALHQGLDREEMGVDVLQIGNGLLECIARFLRHGRARGCRI